MHGVRLVLQASGGDRRPADRRGGLVVAAFGGVPAWLSKQVRCERVPIADDFGGTLLVLPGPISASHPVGHVRGLRDAFPSARVRVVAEPGAAGALAVLAAHGEDDWLSHASDLRIELARPPQDARVTESAWGGTPPLELESARDALALSGFTLNASELAGALHVCAV